MRTLRANDYRRMKWKNGGGETAEIAVFPPEADSDDFDWRISMADVAADGPFSIFPGIDRTLGVLQGEGIALAIDGRSPVCLSQQSDPYFFPADVGCKAQLLNGPILDLNVMTRRGTFTHAVRRIDVRGEVNLNGPGEICVLLCCCSNLCVGIGRFTAELHMLDSLIQVDSSRSITVEGQGTAFFIEIHSISSEPRKNKMPQY